MSFLKKIQQCNNMRQACFAPLLVSGKQVGWLRDDFIAALKPFSEVFEFTEQAVHMHDALNDQVVRSEAIQNIANVLVRDGRIGQPYGEIYPATSGRKDSPEFLIDRGIASWFGTRTFGQHLNGYVIRKDQMYMWIARRAMDRGYEPGKLDQLVAGGFPHGISSQENLRKECMEEAGMKRELVDRAVATGAITCRYENPRGVKPETLYCYDLELPSDFQPVCTDGEVDEFLLLPVEEVAEIVRHSSEFKPNCNLVVIDFLIRHGYLSSGDDDYDQLVAGLHQ